MTINTKLIDLPLEVLIGVCEALHEAYQPSVADFSLVSSHCCRAANVLKFRTIKIHATSTHHLYETALRWIEVLAAVDGFSHVRSLRLKVCDQDFHDSEEDNRAWPMMASLLNKMCSLTDLIYDSWIAFPATLLSVLQDNSRPVCRLNVKDFKLWSLVNFLHGHGAKGFEIIQDDFLYASSRNLHAITVNLKSGTGNGDPDPDPTLDPYQLVAIQQFIRSGNPNLKVVEIRRDSPREPDDSRLPRLSQAWHTLKVRLPEQPRQGALESLHISEIGALTSKCFANWHSYVGFETLRSLELWGGVDISVLQWVIERSPTRFSVFPSLTCLELVGRERTHYATPPQEIASTVQEFLRRIPPLERLTLKYSPFDVSENTTRSIMAMIIGYHGSTLLHLSLPQVQHARPTIQFAGEMNDLVKGCPKLEYLHISIARSEGDAEEVAIYRQLGMHPRLQEIRLTLDCTGDTLRTHLKDPSDILPWNNHSYLCNGHILKSLVNAAIDGWLAAAIFERIANAKPLAASSLKSLEIKTSHAGVFRSMHFLEMSNWESSIDPNIVHPLFKELSRDMWTATPHPSDARPGVVDVQASVPFSFEAPSPLGDIEPLVRVLWPENATGERRFSWHSFPLVD